MNKKIRIFFWSILMQFLYTISYFGNGEMCGYYKSNSAIIRKSAGTCIEVCKWKDKNLSQSNYSIQTKNTYDEYNTHMHTQQAHNLKIKHLQTICKQKNKNE